MLTVRRKTQIQQKIGNSIEHSDMFEFEIEFEKGTSSSSTILLEFQTKNDHEEITVENVQVVPPKFHASKVGPNDGIWSVNKNENIESGDTITIRARPTRRGSGIIEDELELHVYVGHSSHNREPIDSDSIEFRA